MKVLVTGGAGFIGSHIVDKLVALGDEVVIVDNLSTGEESNINDKATFYNVDITDREALEAVFEGEKPEYVIHHAAQIDVQQSLKNPAFDAQVNIVGTIHLLENCQKYGVKKIVYASSAAVYGTPEYLGVDEKHVVAPLSFYGISKFTPEFYIKTFASLCKMKYTILRYANVYGIRQDPKGEGGVVSIFVDKYLVNEVPTIFGDGEHTRDFIYVDDIVDANIAALTKGDGEVCNISCNKQTSINELVRTMNGLFGKDVQAVYAVERAGDIVHSYLDNSIAKEALQWTPNYSLEQGLRKTIDYYKEAYRN
jgi:UDP-glucose 4-epimerase